MYPSDDFVSRNPFTGELIQTIPSWNESDIDKALRKSEKAYHDWRHTSGWVKNQFLVSLAENLRSNMAVLAKIITDEVGKPIVQSEAEILKSAKLCDYYAKHIDSLSQGRQIDLGNDRVGIISHRPQGAVLGIMPWNFPVWQSIRFAVPVIAGGNVVLLKHAQNVGMTATLIEKAIREATGMEDVLISIFCGHRAIDQIMGDWHVCGVSVTGSERAGIAVGRLSGSHIKKSVMELGGSDSYIVLSDANVKKAAIQGARGRLNNNGQTCIAAKRFIVEASVYSDFLHEFVGAIKSFKVGSPYLRDTQVSGLARPDLANSLQEQVSQTLKLGGKQVLAGGLTAQSDTLFHPAVLEDIPRESPAATEELFGPVAAVFCVKDVDEAITFANNTRYGLAATIWSEDTKRALLVAQQLECGSISINEMMSSDPRLPFGGIKKSGFGREMSSEGYFEFLNTTTIIV